MMALDYVVITSVDRDDLADFGAGAFAATILAVHARRPECRVEVLIPDFQGQERPLRTVLEAQPNVLNHNTETVPRLYRQARPGGRYTRALELLGMGETNEEVLLTMRELRAVDVDILTLGQYLRPSSAHMVMERYYTPDEFRELKRIALDLGFGHVESGPLVRSSYHAHEQAESYDRSTAPPA